MTGPIPDLGLLPSVTVRVVRRVRSGTDAYGGPLWRDEEEEVPGVLVTPGSTSDLEASRPEGSTVTMTFHFPKGYGRALKGCSIEYGGGTYRVVGDPRPYIAEGTPGPWGLVVGTEAVDG